MANTTPGILGHRTFYKPFDYPWAFEAFRAQNQIHWIPEEVPMDKDIHDYNHKLTNEERHLITQVLKFFTQADLDVGNNYMDSLLGWFHLPEIRMMLSSFTAMECVHVHAYAFLSDSLNLSTDVEFYQTFLDIESMAKKHQFLQSMKIDSPHKLPLLLAVYGGFIEGVQLFSSFAILNNFPRRNLLKNTGQIITWSIRDESLHCASISRLFRELIHENPHFMTKELRDEIYSACDEVISLEDAFIDACFELGPVEGLSPKDIKNYIRYIADVRLDGLGFAPRFKLKEHPMPWLIEITNGVDHTNFFENRVTSYSKGIIIEDLVR